MYCVIAQESEKSYKSCQMFTKIKGMGKKYKKYYIHSQVTVPECFFKGLSVSHAMNYAKDLTEILVSLY